MCLIFWLMLYFRGPGFEYQMKNEFLFSACFFQMNACVLPSNKPKLFPSQVTYISILSSHFIIIHLCFHCRRLSYDKAFISVLPPISAPLIFLSTLSLLFSSLTWSVHLVIVSPVVHFSISQE